LASFEEYLLGERALATSTVAAYVARARRFLDGRASDDRLAGLTAGEVTEAVLRESRRASARSTQYFVAAPRSFLRFCFIEGLVGTDLSQAALAVTARRSSPLRSGSAGRTPTLLGDRPPATGDRAA
jgi:site-specific recombinase XerD